MLRIALLLVVTLAASPAFAAAGDWQELAPGVRARLIASGEMTNGKMLAGLEIDMPQSTNTYWRVPGETGIPTVLDFSASSGIASAQVLWPFPLIETTQGYRDYVYRGPTVLPVELVLDDNAAARILEIALTLGVCDEMCVPASGKFSLPLDETRDAGQSVRLQQAVALTPIAWDAAAPAIGRATLNGDSIQLESLAPGIDPSTLIATSGDSMLLFGAPQKSPDKAIWLLPLLGETEASSLAGQTLDFTFLTGQGAYSASATVESPSR
jgi:DsbC/DsbD-like thiol-disulfide interchange protein